MESDLNIVPSRDDRHPKIHMNKHLLIADSRLEDSQKRNFDNLCHGLSTSVLFYVY
jgi:hypothetical protein